MAALRWIKVTALSWRRDPGSAPASACEVGASTLRSSERRPCRQGATAVTGAPDL